MAMVTLCLSLRGYLAIIKVKKITAGKITLTVSMKRVAGGKAYRACCAVKGSDKYKVHYIAYKKASAKSSSAITRTTDKTSPKVK